MSSELIAINVDDVTKRFALYDSPIERVQRSIRNRVRRVAGKKYEASDKEFTALTNVSFTVRKGETVGIVGRNGSGKSTLLQLICGTLAPTSGKVAVVGRVNALLELGAGFNPDYTGRQNVFLNCAILGMSKSETEKKLPTIREFANIGRFFDQPVKTYSSGMYVRLAFATAIHTDPEVLIVDEALAVGDESFQRKCFARLRALQARGCTILFVSHSAQSVIELCDRAILLEGGYVILSGDPKFVTSRYQKLVHAPDEAVASILKDFEAETAQNMAGAIVVKKPEESHLDESVVKPTVRDVEDPYTLALELEGFDPSMKSQSVVRYNSQGAEASNVRIVNEAGEVCNILAFGQNYKLKYDVLVTRDFDSLNYAYAVKSVSGIEIASGWKYPQGQGLEVKKGDRFTTSFDIDMRLIPETYFLNVGLFSFDDGDFTQVDRCVDVHLFKVAPFTMSAPRYGFIALSE